MFTSESSCVLRLISNCIFSDRHPVADDIKPEKKLRLLIVNKFIISILYKKKQQTNKVNNERKCILAFFIECEEIICVFLVFFSNCSSMSLCNPSISICFMSNNNLKQKRTHTHSL